MMEFTLMLFRRGNGYCGDNKIKNPLKRTISSSMTRISSILVCSNLLKITKLSMLGNDRRIDKYIGSGFAKIPPTF